MSGRAGWIRWTDMVGKNVQEKEIVHHPFAPLGDPRGRVLILGSMPSVMSRQNNFYYGHPQNRF